MQPTEILQEVQDSISRAQNLLVENPASVNSVILELNAAWGLIQTLREKFKREDEINKLFY